MKTITLRVPESLELSEHDYLMALASKLYEDGRLSSGQAAEIVGISKRTFIETIGNYGVSLFSNSIDDLNSDLSNA
jgi:predicted HTH domain antitoxin